MPRLDGAKVGPGLSLDFDGVGVVALSEQSPASVLDVMTPEDMQQVLADELRVFGRNSPEFSFKCWEEVVCGVLAGQALVTRFLARKGGDTRDSFEDRWNGRHAEIATAAVKNVGYVERYVHNVLTADPPPSYQYDGISETWFASVEDAVRSLADPDLSVVEKDRAEFCARNRSVTLLTEVIHSKSAG